MVLAGIGEEVGVEMVGVEEVVVLGMEEER